MLWLFLKLWEFKENASCLCHQLLLNRISLADCCVEAAVYGLTHR